jgi:hypothetical protein
MKKVIVFLLLLLILTGCVTAPTQEEISKMDFGAPPQNYETTIKKYFDSTLFDPYSAHYDFQSPQQYYYKQSPLAGGGLYAGYRVCVGVNAKNRYGGYVGEKMYAFIIKDERIIKVLDELELQSIKTFK